VERLQELANRYRGPSVIAMRTQPVPAAYRSFFRQIGLNPDVTRPPGEQAALTRLFDGTFKPRGHLADALLVALLETGVPIWALDAARAAPHRLGIRPARAGETLGAPPDGEPVSAGTLVVAAEERIHAVLFGAPARDSAVSATTSELLLYAISVDGVPSIHVEEAFWMAGEALRTGV
jgi:DNA/RNA-binding domain of Phe-tRNA-synthetase-like protein